MYSSHIMQIKTFNGDVAQCQYKILRESSNTYGLP